MAVQVSPFQREPDSDGIGQTFGLISSIGGMINPALGAAFGAAGKLRQKHQNQGAMDRRLGALQTTGPDPVTQLQEAQGIVSQIQDPELRKKFAQPLVEAEFALQRGR